MRPDLLQAARELLSEIGLDHPMLPCDLVRASIRDQLAMMQNEHTLGERENNLHDVLDDQDGDAARGNLAHEGKRALDLARVEAGIDLVEHQHARPHGEALGGLETLAPAKR